MDSAHLSGATQEACLEPCLPPGHTSQYPMAARSRTSQVNRVGP